MNIRGVFSTSYEDVAVSRLIRAFRERAGISQDELASTAGLAATALKRIECSERPATILELHAICQALEVSIDEIATNAARIAAQHASRKGLLLNGLRNERNMSN